MPLMRDCILWQRGQNVFRPLAESDRFRELIITVSSRVLGVMGALMGDYTIIFLQWFHDADHNYVPYLSSPLQNCF